MKRLKFLIFIGAVVVCSLPLGSKADFSGFVEQLRESNIPVDKILTQTGITRYEVTRLLNATECKDCVNPDSAYINKYTSSYWADFTKKPGQYFDDIKYALATYNKKNYYYCVAYVGDNGYMKGYPRETSPVCAGQFCGLRMVTKAEFLQVVMNIISKYVYNMYALNWQEVKNRITSLDDNSYEYKNFSSQDITSIYDRAKTCKTSSCILENTNELNIYLKYCMFNLESCGMTKIGGVKEGSRPVAELNLLSKQEVLDIDEAEAYDIGDMINGKLVLSIFGKVNDLVGCVFIDDYDCDGIENTQDTCPNTYNPHQRDTDNDSIGDVCDNDIDNDGVRNPIGIVDDNGNILISLWDKNEDNCILISNADQKRTSDSILGDACTNLENLSLAIKILNLGTNFSQGVKFAPVYKQDFKEYNWDFGDGVISTGKLVSHSYLNPGIYPVRLVAKTNSGKISLAKTTVIIGQASSQKRAIQPIINTLIINKNTSTTISLSEIGDFDYYEWKFSDSTTGIQTKIPSIRRIFRSEGSVEIIVKGFVGNTVVAASTFSIVVEKGKGSVLHASVLNPEKGDTLSFSTNTAGFFPKDVRMVNWNFGDGNSMDTQGLTINHTYKTSGQKVVVQTISLADGGSIRNILTVYVVQPYQFNDFAINFLEQSTSLVSPVNFTTTIQGSFEKPISFSVNYGDTKSQIISTEKNTSPFSSQHLYKASSVYYPQTKLVLGMCTNLSAQATVDVQGYDTCLNAKASGTLKNLGCDTDMDGIPDMCDNDIDNDGKLNLLGIITNPQKCNYTETLTQNAVNNGIWNNNINYEILRLHFQGICTLDNDPFNKNENQEDNNNNNIGDTLDVILKSGSNNLENTFDSFIDSDADGITDSQDVCPTLAETYNGVLDSDGCPEIGVDLSCENSRFPMLTNIEPLLSSCGNGRIDSGETCQSCPSDVGVCSPNCGNGKIDSNETCQSCPIDVGYCISICGDGIQQAGENCSNCPKDAGICNPSTCGDGKINSGENCINCPKDVGACISICGDGIQQAGENCSNCPKDAGICNPSTCGDGKINSGETCSNCPIDVGICIPNCGDGKINSGENCINCPKDVGACISICGDGIQQAGENCSNCPKDAGICNPSTCGDGKINSGENCINCPKDVGACIPNCGDGKINSGENCINCPKDVGACISICGDGIQQAGENCSNCPKDAGICNPSTCGDGKINSGENCINCPKDVGACISICGDGIQQAGENCSNCPKDAGICIPNCGDGKIDSGETCSNCSIDVGICIPNCGDGKIDSGETCSNCSIDVGICIPNCGDGKINSGENCINCPKDVGTCISICGDGIQQAGENCSNCPKDAGICNPSTCGNNKIDSGETCQSCSKDVGTCISICGDGIQQAGENCSNCPVDVGTCNPYSCGNGKIDSGETCSNCPIDVGICIPNCGDGKIDSGETCVNCPIDVGYCISICGDGIQQAGETCSNCPVDVGTCLSTCGNGKIDSGETCSNCSIDVGLCLSTCGNRKIDSGETCQSCPIDAGSCSISCGNSKIDSNETCVNCPTDLGKCYLTCGNGKIDSGETSTNCPLDVPIYLPECGNGITEYILHEECDNGIQNGKNGICSASCTLLGLCGNGEIDSSENCQTCPSDVQLCTSLCGNGKINLNEECDNGLQKNGKDGICSASCALIQLCGNGKIDSSETCQSCPIDVQLCTSLCGNSILDVSLGEQCDNGFQKNGKDGICSASCTLLGLCGNGKIDSGETCSNCPIDVQLCSSPCGNSILDVSLGEQCDNGFQKNGKDGICSASCTLLGLCGNGKIDSGETCSNCPIDVQLCSSPCGDGKITLNEECDNGLQKNGRDGICSTSCTLLGLCGNGKIDSGETCSNCPIDVQLCSSPCGDGKITLNEECDNGLQKNGRDGICSTSCTLLGLCGNGKIDSGETCSNCPIDVQLCSSPCGDGEVTLNEQCDNGFQKNGKDGICSASCTLLSLCGNGKIDSGETCQSCRIDIQQLCSSRCGNGIVETALGEQCDNGLENNGKDGICSLYCAGTPSNLCGNGVQDAGEDCLTCPQDSKDCLLITTKECLQCPCPFADFSANITNGDQIKAVLWDKLKIYPWKYSVGYDINF